MGSRIYERNLTPHDVSYHFLLDDRMISHFLLPHVSENDRTSLNHGNFVPIPTHDCQMNKDYIFVFKIYDNDFGTIVQGWINFKTDRILKVGDNVKFYFNENPYFIRISVTLPSQNFPRKLRTQTIRGNKTIKGLSEKECIAIEALLLLSKKVVAFNEKESKSGDKQNAIEIVNLLLETGVDINVRNYLFQTALMQACQHGHWEAVQTLILFKANIHRADYLNGGTVLHLASLNGHTRCIRLLLADYIPSLPNTWYLLQKKSKKECGNSEFNASAVHQVVNKPADGGITALHMAALNGHFDSVQLVLDLGATVSEITAEDGTTIDLIGSGSTPLHYAACGGNSQCCQLLIATGASLTAENANGWIPLMVARLWHRDSILGIVSALQAIELPTTPSPFLSLSLMSIIKIASMPRCQGGDCGWRNSELISTCQDPCVVCLEGRCTVASEGCSHEFCARCVLYICTMNCSSTVAKGPPGSVPCPLCRHGIVSFVKLPVTRPIPKEVARTILSLSCCGCTCEKNERASMTVPLCKAPSLPSSCSRISPSSSSFRSLSCQRFPLVKLNSGCCMGGSETSPSIVSGSMNRSLRTK